MSTKTNISRASAIILTLGLLGPPPALASASPVQAGVPADARALEVSVDPEMFQADAHRTWVEERGRAALERWRPGLEPGEHIVVELAGNAYDYRVTVRVARGGLPLAEQPAPFACGGSTDELLALGARPCKWQAPA